VIDLLDADLPQGDHSLVWDGRDENNLSVASGIYFIKLEAGGKTSIRKAILLK
jgi:flagellar hook assembly protein FlgD